MYLRKIVKFLNTEMSVFFQVPDSVKGTRHHFLTRVAILLKFLEEL